MSLKEAGFLFSKEGFVSQSEKYGGIDTVDAFKLSFLCRAHPEVGRILSSLLGEEHPFMYVLPFDLDKMKGFDPKERVMTDFFFDLVSKDDDPDSDEDDDAVMDPEIFKDPNVVSVKDFLGSYVCKETTYHVFGNKNNDLVVCIRADIIDLPEDVGAAAGGAAAGGAAAGGDAAGGGAAGGGAAGGGAADGAAAGGGVVPGPVPDFDEVPPGEPF